MRCAIVLFVILSTGLALLGCEGKGGYRDVALIAQADRALTRIRNSLEEYYLDHGSYPGEKADLREALSPYFFRVVFLEGDVIARHFVTITDARNRLAQVRDRLTEYQAEMEEALSDSGQVAGLKGVLQEIQGTGESYERELEERTAGSLPKYRGEFFDRLEEMVAALDLNRMHESLGDSLIVQGDAVISMLREHRKAMEESLEDSLQIEELGSYIEAAADAWVEHRSDTLAGGIGPVGFPSATEIQAIKEILPEGDSTFLQIEQLVIDYYGVEQQREAIAVFEGSQWKAKRASDLLKDYDKKLRQRAKKASVIVKAQGELKEMGEAIEAYRGETGTYPEDGLALDRFFQEEYVQTMPEGARKYVYKVDYLTGPPAYSTSDPTMSFRLDGTVDDESRTSLFCDVKMVNEWDEVVATFSEAPVYVTIDSTITYFVTGRANDSDKTPLSVRPAVVREREEEEAEKTKKAKRGRR